MLGLFLGISKVILNINGAFTSWNKNEVEWEWTGKEMRNGNEISMFTWQK